MQKRSPGFSGLPHFMQKAFGAGPDGAAGAAEGAAAAARVAPHSLQNLLWAPTWAPQTGQTLPEAWNAGTAFCAAAC